MSRILLSSVAAVAVLASAHGAAAQTEIQWWHAMGGELGEKVDEIADRLQQVARPTTRSSPVFKGSYPETLTAAIAAFRAKQRRTSCRSSRSAPATMMAAKGAVYPVYQLMADASEPFDPKAFLGPVVRLLLDTDGNMLSMPFNSSTPMIYYNKDVFKKAGLDPEQAAEDLAGSWASGRQEARRLGRQVRLHHRLDDLDPDRELRRLAQPAVRHQGRTASAALDTELKFNDAPSSSMISEAGRLEQGQGSSTAAARASRTADVLRAANARCTWTRRARRAAS